MDRHKEQLNPDAPQIKIGQSPTDNGLIFWPNTGQYF